MSAVQLALINLGELANGAAGAVIDAALQAAIRDTEDRGLEDGKPRKVTITISLTKIDDETVTAEVEAKTSVPAYKPKKTVLNISYAGAGKVPALLFQPASADRADQETFPFPKEKAE
jgi:hypothetical protein